MQFPSKLLHATVLPITAFAAILLAKPAEAYDIDCKIILCLPAGFPSGCEDAFDTFIDRITSVPPKPPIGFCAMGSPHDIVMHDDHPERFAVMNSITDDEALERVLASVKIEYFASRRDCQAGVDSDPVPCTQTYAMDGDGRNFQIYSKRGHHRGIKVTHLTMDGIACVSGTSASYSEPRYSCTQYGDYENCQLVSSGSWTTNATCGLGEGFGIGTTSFSTGNSLGR